MWMLTGSDMTMISEKNLFTFQSATTSNTMGRDIAAMVFDGVMIPAIATTRFTVLKFIQM